MVTLGCGLISGTAAALVSQPGDTVLSVMNKQAGTSVCLSCRMSHVSRVACRMSLMSHVACRMSHVACLVSQPADATSVGMMLPKTPHA
jgi:hypothetical protein